MASKSLNERMLCYERAEDLGEKLYAYMAKCEKNEDNRRILLRLAEDEHSHYETWKSYTGMDAHVSPVKLFFKKISARVLGYTFSLKKLNREEQLTSAEYALLKENVPEAAKMSADEKAHENALINMLDEERLQYVGAMVLGLNDALVELTGAIAGVTFALANTRLIALTGIVTGVSATLSMAASNFLAERASGNPHAAKSSLYTGIAYMATVVLLVLPYLLFPAGMYAAALGTMLATVVLIILLFNYYISVAKSEPFGRHFLEMLVISLGVAALSFVIAIFAKKLLGIDI